MKPHKDFMPSDESPVEDRRKMQGPPTKELAEEAANAKAWDEYYESQRKAQKEARDTASSRTSKASKNAGEYGARMKKRDRDMKSAEDAYDAMVDAEVKSYYKNLKGSKEHDAALKDISSTFRKNAKGAKPLAGKGYKSGGVVRGSGKARGVKPCKIC